MNCPNCGSPNTKSFSMVYDMYSSDDLSGLKYKCSPPSPPTINTPLLLVMGCVSVYVAFTVAGWRIFSSYWLAGLITFIACFWGLRKLWFITIGEKQEDLHRQHYAAWEKSWLCMQCNTSYNFSPKQPMDDLNDSRS